MTKPLLPNYTTPEYDKAVERVGERNIGFAYADLRAGTVPVEVRALSIDGCVKLAAKAAQERNATVVEFGSLGGCANTSEEEALEVIYAMS